MTKSNLSSNLQQLMRIHGNLSPSELSKRIGIPQPTIHHMLFGSTKNPWKKNLEALAKYFSISIEQLTGEEELPQIIPENIKEDLQLRTIPIIDWGMLNHWLQDKERTKPAKEILLEKEITPNSFAVIIDDSSMGPMFPVNSLLIFDAGKTPKDRDYVIAKIGDNNSILFNRLFADNSELYLKQEAVGEDVRLIKLNKSSDKIIGVLTEARIQY